MNKNIINQLKSVQYFMQNFMQFNININTRKRGNTF